MLPVRVRAGGRLLYTTCSLRQLENEQVAAQLQADSRLGFRAMVEGAPLEASFERFEVRPRWDSRYRPRGFRVEVDLREVASGDPDVDSAMRGAEWFDTQHQPLAHFSSSRIDGAGRDGYLMHGELTVKGVSRALGIPFDWHVDSKGVRMKGEVVLDRRWFGVGPQDVSSVAAEVRVSFELQWSLP